MTPWIYEQLGNMLDERRNLIEADWRDQLDLLATVADALAQDAGVPNLYTQRAGFNGLINAFFQPSLAHSHLAGEGGSVSEIHRLVG